MRWDMMWCRVMSCDLMWSDEMGCRMSWCEVMWLCDMVNWEMMCCELPTTPCHSKTLEMSIPMCGATPGCKTQVGSGEPMPQQFSQCYNSKLQFFWVRLLSTTTYLKNYYSNTSRYYKVLLRTRMYYSVLQSTIRSIFPLYTKSLRIAKYYYALQSIIAALLHTRRYYFVLLPESERMQFHHMLPPYGKKHPKLKETSVGSEHDPRSNHEPVSLHFACENATSRAPAPFQKVEILALALSRKVTTWSKFATATKSDAPTSHQLHQILCLPGKVTWQIYQIPRLPGKVTLQHHHTLRVPREVTLLPLFLQWTIDCPLIEQFLDWTFPWLNSSLAELVVDWTMPGLNNSLTEQILDWNSPWLNKSLAEYFLDWRFLDWGSPWLNHSLTESFLDRFFLGWTFPWLNESLDRIVPWLSCFLTEPIVFYEWVIYWYLLRLFFFKGDLICFTCSCVIVCGIERFY